MQPLPTVHDLPPYWDGQRVEWTEWHPPTPMFICPPPKPDRCPMCGMAEQPSHAYGTVHPPAGATELREVRRRTASGRTYTRQAEVPAGPTRRLMAMRCPACTHDQVLDLSSGELWNLDPGDYNDEGSVAP